MSTKTVGQGPFRIAIDVGGTFVDYVLINETSGEITIEKQLSTTATIAEEISAGLSRLPVDLTDVGRIFHGTTIVVNAIVQEKGVQVGLLTTSGFRDILEIARGSRPELYNPFCREPFPLVPRHLRREIPGRLGVSGDEIAPLDLESVDRESDALVAAGCDAIAICFIHSYANPEHERLAAERVRQRHPAVATTASHELVREWREYERTSTTVLNAYAQPQFNGYVDRVVNGLRDAGYARPLALMQSNGGVSSAARAATRPITTLESGPAGGVIGAHALAAELNLANVICVDVGGTTCDVALIESGRIVERTLTRIAGRPVLGPTIDIKSVGAGGGSVAGIDSRGALRVGPQSAGASPGPACFGLGGVQPTVTDCQLLLGRLDPSTFLGARMQLDQKAAEAALRPLAEGLEMSLHETAVGVVRIAETNMTNAIRSITVERGVDPRDFTMMSYGGGGGLFAASVSDELGIASVVIPRAPANFSAWGILTSDYREDNARTLVRPLDADAAREIVVTVEGLSAENDERLESYGFSSESIDSSARVDIRFAGQEYTVTVPVEQRWLSNGDHLLEAVRERFVDLHRRLYGHGDDAAPLELVTVRVRSVGEVAKPRWRPWPDGTQATPALWRETDFADYQGMRATALFPRDQLAAGQSVEGAAVIEEWTSTTLVPPGWEATVDATGSLVLSRGRES
jgi:N-methylhydantoinase A